VLRPQKCEQFPLGKNNLHYRSCCAGLLQHSGLDHTHTSPRFKCLLCCSISLQDHEVHVVGNVRVPRVEQPGLAARKRKFDFKICVGEDEELVFGGDHAERLDVLGVVNTRDLHECPTAPGKRFLCDVAFHRGRRRVVPPHLAVVSVQVVHFLQPLAETAVEALSGGQGSVWQLVPR
jgi:hypothetical protein